MRKTEREREYRRMRKKIEKVFLAHPGSWPPPAQWLLIWNLNKKTNQNVKEFFVCSLRTILLPFCTFTKCLPWYQAQLLTCGYNCTYSVPWNLSQKLCHSFMCNFSVPVVKPSAAKSNNWEYQCSRMPVICLWVNWLVDVDKFHCALSTINRWISTWDLQFVVLSHLKFS